MMGRLCIVTYGGQTQAAVVPRYQIPLEAESMSFRVLSMSILPLEEWYHIVSDKQDDVLPILAGILSTRY